MLLIDMGLDGSPTLPTETSATDSEPDVLQCFVAMSWPNLSGFRQTRATVQHAGKTHGYWVL